MLPVQTTWKKKLQNRPPCHNLMEKSKTWGCPRSCLHSLKKPDSCQQRYCYPKEMKRRKTLKRIQFFHTTYQLLPIFLPWHFCKTYLLTTKKKRHSNLYLLLYYKLNYITLHSGSTTLLYYYIQIYYFVLYILLLPINYCHVKFSIFYTTEFTKNDEHF